MKNANRHSGVLPVGGVVVQSALHLFIPATITLTSTDAGRKIELSTDGTNYYQPTYDVTQAGMINVSVQSPIRTFKITGAAGDTWSIL
jgi:hypothetical protein